MSAESKDAMINSRLLIDYAYRDASRLDRRKAIYQYTSPSFIIEDEVIRLLSLKSEQNLLDLGCGTGKLLLKAALQSPRSNLVGLDISQGMLQSAREKSKMEGLRINFVLGDVQKLPFKDSSFDRITAMHMLYHADDIDQALYEIHRVVKPQGLVIITANSKDSRKQLGFLKKQAAEIMQREVFTDPNMRFNLEVGLEKTAMHFNYVALISFGSTLRLTDPQPYMDYFDSLREFWHPIPTDKEWSMALKSTKQYVEDQIKLKGAFTDTTGFGVIVGSKSPIPEKMLNKITNE